MVTFVKEDIPQELVGLSSDVKPTGAPNGSKFYEVDTSAKYTYDAEGGQWYEDAEDATVPAVSSSDNGKVLTVVGGSWKKAALPALSAATTSALGGVKMAANVAEAAGDAPTAAEFKALLDALIAAGIMAEA